MTIGLFLRDCPQIAEISNVCVTVRETLIVEMKSFEPIKEITFLCVMEEKMSYAVHTNVCSSLLMNREV